jgi:hypothetical protein
MTFQDFGGSESGDDIAAVLDFRKKNYRERICLNKIAEFDFRQYLFARQSHVRFYPLLFVYFFGNPASVLATLPTLSST